MGENGFTLTSLIVTIIIIVLLAALGGYYSFEILGKSRQMEFESELRNVEELVSIHRARIAVGEIIIPERYLATEEQIDENFSDVLSESEKNLIMSNGMYYFMNQSVFDNIFGESINVKDAKRDYLINFDEKIIISNAGVEYRVGVIK